MTAPRGGRPRRTTVASEIDAQTELGEVFMRSLMRSQLRLGLRTVALLVVTVGLWPVLFATVPPLRTAHLGAIPLPWLILGVAVYPVLVLLGWWHASSAERLERDFLDLTDRPTRSAREDDGR
ncbi:MAG TPA: hypothetical protein VF426_12280 [Marmoricola sp.]